MVVNLIVKMMIVKGLIVTCCLDYCKYFMGCKVIKDEMKVFNFYLDKFHGEWNYVIRLY